MKLILWLSFGFLVGIIANALSPHYIFTTITILAVFAVIGVMLGGTEILLSKKH